MWLCNVVDTSIDEDREYLEFWYADIVYSKATNSLYGSQKISFEDWLHENTKYNCSYIPKPSKENQL